MRTEDYTTRQGAFPFERPDPQHATHTPIAFTMTDSPNLERLTDAFYERLRRETEINCVNGVAVITTPFVDRHNDFLSICVLHREGRPILSDIGNTIADLETCGCDTQTPEHRRLFETIVRSYGAELSADNELVVPFDTDDFPEKLHRLLQAMLAVDAVGRFQ